MPRQETLHGLQVGSVLPQRDRTQPRDHIQGRPGVEPARLLRLGLGKLPRHQEINQRLHSHASRSSRELGQQDATHSCPEQYTTACLTAQEVQWIRQMLAEIGAHISKEPTTVHADSQSAIHMRNNPTAGREKHIDIKAHFAKEAQEKRGVVNSKPKIIKFRNTIHGDIEIAKISASISTKLSTHAICRY